jgi:L-asparaginase
MAFKIGDDMEGEKQGKITPRIILHGGAGNINRENLPPEAYNAYKDALKSIVNDAHAGLRLPGATALDVATYAVSLLENNGLFNAGHGAVFTTAETHELEASVMVSRGYRKRGVGIMKATRAKNPIKVAREMLIRGEEKNGGGAQGHCQLEGAIVDRLTEEWGLETVKPSYYWTRRRWDEHRRGKILFRKHFSPLTSANCHALPVGRSG